MFVQHTALKMDTEKVILKKKLSMSLKISKYLSTSAEKSNKYVNQLSFPLAFVCTNTTHSLRVLNMPR